ncbi:MAG: glycine-rich protein, partial [Bacteroidetes bacterium]|nr:glycine-rich protein [Bacteroidota bacterium]
MKKIYKNIFSLFLAGVSISLCAQPTTFNFTGGVQTYVVPVCVTSVTINAYGAQGGGPVGGLGGSATATIPVISGSTLYIYVGGQPTTRPGAGSGGYNGGGAVNALPCGGGTNDGWGGGGASDVRTSVSISNRIIVAGGGGGQGWTSGAGGAGGGLTGSDGAASWIGGTQGFGGTQSAGGAGGFYSPSSAGAGSLGLGGDAGPLSGYCIGGGGGGGYYGGGGGYVSAGAGGSCYISFPGSTATATTAGIHTGNGQVVITPVSGISNPGAITGSAALCANASGNYSIVSMPGATSYTWTVPAGTTINSGQGTTAINITAGSTSGN